MSKFVIKGGNPLNGEIDVAGNKNAVLKMIPATLLTKEKVTLTNVPAITDVRVLLKMMQHHGSEVTYSDKGQTIEIQTKEITNNELDAELAKELRASNMLLGPILARTGEVVGVYPGGDKIGPREMTAHFDAFIKLGYKFEKLNHDRFRLSGKATNSEVFLYEPSVTATENAILAAVFAKNTVVIENAASEPHVQSLCEMLNKMGAKISGIGSNNLQIEGVEELSGTTHAIPSDFIYAGTMMILAAITNGDLTLNRFVHKDMRNILHTFEQVGLVAEKVGESSIRVTPNQKLKVENPSWGRNKGFYSQPWPCFPTDLMSLAIVLGTQVEGTTLFFEKMYPGRMFFANYLNGMGANIIMADPHRVVVSGKTKLKGIKTLSSPDLRAGMAYVAAGLAAEGETVVDHIFHIDRGYPNVEKILTGLGADIKRI